MPSIKIDTEEVMKKYFLICFCLLAQAAFTPGVSAENRAAPEYEQAACFQWEDVRGPDTEWEYWNIHFGGQLAGDAVLYDEDNRKNSGLRWETVNLRITGICEDKFHFHVEPDLMGIDTKHNLYEAWGGWDILPALHLRIGQIKVALNTEFATRPENLPSIDYAFSSYLDGRYDLGVQLDGLLPGNAIWCQGSATAGEGFDLDGNRKSDPQYAVRTVVFPVQLIGSDVLKGGFIGLGAAWSPDYEDEIFLQTPLRSTVFTTPDFKGDYFRCLHTEIGWYSGSFRAGAERVSGEIGDVRIGGGRTEEFDQLTAWSACASWNITGEQMRWERGRWLPPQLDGPKSPAFECLNILNSLGCLEVAVRYANADIDRGLFDSGITTYDPSTQEVRTATVNLNWYPRPGLKLTAGWIKTIADDELSTLGGSNRDSSAILRTILTL
jgi:phosphate-selective porin